MSKIINKISPKLVNEKKKKFVLCGFFGRGNAGDEAFFHVLYDLLKDKYQVVVVVEQGYAHKDFSSWYPYNQCEIWSFDDVNKVYDNDVYGIHIGGGSLPFGYYGHFILSAFDAGKKVFMAGVDAAINTNTHDKGEFKKQIYSKLDFMSVRTKKSYKLLKTAGVDVLHGADWALGLKASNRSAQKTDVLITYRGFSEVNSRHKDDLRLLQSDLEGLGLNVSYLPFAPDDTDFLIHCGVEKNKIIEFWHDPSYVLKIMNNANSIVSIGRLHTLILAMLAEKPVFAIDPGIMVGGRHVVNRKNLYFCKEMGLSFIESIEEFINLSVDSKLSLLKTPRAFPNEYAERFNKMKSQFLKELS